MIWVMLMWAVHLLNLEFDLDLRRFGLIPREMEGLWGILAAPLLHSSNGFEHLINNSIPALVLGWCLFFFYKEMSLSVLLISWIGTGILVWIFGRESVHIGASGVVYALTGFLLVSGFMRGHKGLVALSFAVVFMYGSLVWGVLPVQRGVSWESHLFGGLIGCALAYVYRNIGTQKPVHTWPDEDDEEEDDPNAPWRLPEDRPMPQRTMRPRVTIIYHEKGKGPKPLDPGNTTIS